MNRLGFNLNHLHIEESAGQLKGAVALTQHLMVHQSRASSIPSTLKLTFPCTTDLPDLANGEKALVL